MKIYTNELKHMTNMDAMPIYGKNLKNLLLQKHKTDYLETWYVALSMQGCSNSGQIWSHRLLYGKKSE